MIALAGSGRRATIFLTAWSSEAGSLSLPISRAVSHMRLARSASAMGAFLAGMNPIALAIQGAGLADDAAMRTMTPVRPNPRLDVGISGGSSLN